MVQPRSGVTVKTPSDREFVMTRVFDAPRELVFEALTKPEHLVRWFARRQDTLAVCEVDLRVGGSARFVWRFPDGSEMGITDVYREVIPPEKLVFTETFDPPYTDEMGVRRSTRSPWRSMTATRSSPAQRSISLVRTGTVQWRRAWPTAPRRRSTASTSCLRLCGDKTTTQQI
jgi:uncharacterized protein YndB with AHSA1/START domain